MPSPGGILKARGRRAAAEPATKRWSVDPYCLYCYASLERASGTGTICGSCQRTNLAVDRAAFWTLERRMLMLQAGLRGLVVLLCLCLGLLLFVPLSLGGVGRGGAGGAPIALVTPILLGFFFWDACGVLTCRRTVFRHDLLWPVLPLALLLTPLIFLAGISVLSYRGLPMLGYILLVGLPIGALGAGLWMFGRWLVRRIRQAKQAYLVSRIAPALATESTA